MTIEKELILQNSFDERLVMGVRARGNRVLRVTSDIISNLPAMKGYICFRTAPQKIFDKLRFITAVMLAHTQVIIFMDAAHHKYQGDTAKFQSRMQVMPSTGAMI